jgi:hypothetical protein
MLRRLDGATRCRSDFDLSACLKPDLVVVSRKSGAEGSFVGIPLLACGSDDIPADRDGVLHASENPRDLVVRGAQAGYGLSMLRDENLFPALLDFIHTMAIRAVA